MRKLSVKGSNQSSPEDRAVVVQERDEMRRFVKELSGDDITSGSWFTKLLMHSLSTYTSTVDWQYFQERYRGLPPDIIVDQRIRMAARYAAIGGGLSASAYTGAVAATIGSLGGASPATVPVATATMLVDVAYTSRLQLHLAYDIAVLYRVPLDLNDPDDLWKLIRIAFTIKGGEAVSEGLLKAVPAAVRPLIKRYYSKGVLHAAKGLPVVGKHLLQRNVIKIGIPLVGVPLAVLVNRQTTLIAGRHARVVFRNEARIVEIARQLVTDTRHPDLVLWLAWLVTVADNKTNDDIALLLRYLAALLEEEHSVMDDDLTALITTDAAAIWCRLETADGDRSDLIQAAHRIGQVAGSSSRTRAVVAEIAERLGSGNGGGRPSKLVRSG